MHWNVCEGSVCGEAAWGVGGPNQPEGWGKRRGGVGGIDIRLQTASVGKKRPRLRTGRLHRQELVGLTASGFLKKENPLGFTHVGNPQDQIFQVISKLWVLNSDKSPPHFAYHPHPHIHNAGRSSPTPHPLSGGLTFQTNTVHPE